MGDRTPIEIVIYSCPPEEVNVVLEIFDEFGLDHDYRLPGDPPPGPDGRGPRRLELGRGYINSEISVGSSDELAALLPNHTRRGGCGRTLCTSTWGRYTCTTRTSAGSPATATRKGGRCSTPVRSMHWSSAAAETGSSWATSPAARGRSRSNNSSRRTAASSYTPTLPLHQHPCRRSRSVNSRAGHRGGCLRTLPDKHGRPQRQTGDSALSDPPAARLLLGSVPSQP